MKLVVVEPHPDDAFLSLGWHLEKLWAEHELTIVSVYHDSRRGKEGREYAEAVGAGYLGLGLPQSKMLGNLGKLTEPTLNQLLDPLESDVVVLPLGFQHPDHLRVSKARINKAEVWYYVDSPYQLKLKNQTKLLKKLWETEIVSIVYPPKGKWKHIPIFGSQAKFFHYNPVEKLRTHELVVKKKKPFVRRQKGFEMCNG